MNSEKNEKKLKILRKFVLFSLISFSKWKVEDNSNETLINLLNQSSICSGVYESIYDIEFIRLCNKVNYSSFNSFDFIDRL